MLKHKIYDNSFNKCEKDMNTDEEIITVNKSDLIDGIDGILTLMAVVFILGVCIGALITLILVNFSR